MRRLSGWGPALVVVLLLLGAARMFAVVLHEPVLGYANNHDMWRIQACYDIWPAEWLAKPKDATREAPLDTYQFGPPLEGVCHLSSELLLTSPAAWLTQLVASVRGENTISITTFGMLKALALAAVAVFVSAWLLKGGDAFGALVNAAIFALVLADPANTLYANGFYMEFSAMLFAYVTLAMGYVAVRLCSAAATIALGFGAAMLMLSKAQHIPLALALCGLFVVLEWRRLPKRALVAALALVLLALPARLHSLNFGDNPFIRNNGKWHTILGAALPNASAPPLAATWLGLPPSCAESAVASRLRGSLTASPNCLSAAIATPYARVGLLLLRDPSTLMRMTLGGLDDLRPWLTPTSYLGQVAGKFHGASSEFVWSASALFDALSGAMWFAVFFVPLLLAMACAGVWAAGRFAGLAAGWCLVAMLSASTYVVFFASLFGDGYADFSRHNHLWFSLYLALVVIVAAAMAERIARARWSKMNL